MSRTREALEVARQLAARGVPIFLARPARKAGRWDRTGGHNGTGYWLPRQWQNTVADPAVVDRWRPEDALCAVMGHKVDALDLDPRNGGDQTRAGLAAADMWPETYGTATTPSGGTHELIAPLGVGSRDAVRPGLDLKGGRPDGSGRGYIFIAPTQKVSKETGEIGEYRWVVPPDLDRLEDNTDDDSGQAIADLVRAARTGNSSNGGGDETPREWMVADVIPRGRRYPWLRSYAGWLRDRGVRRSEADILMRRRWEACEQPADDRMPWDDAEALLDDIYGRYQPSAIPALTVLDADNSAAASPGEPGTAAKPALEFVRFDDLAAEVDAAGPRRWLIRGIWPAGDYGIHAAEPKAQKTWNSIDLAVSVATGTPWLGTFPIDTPGPAIIFHGEGGKRGLVRRVRAVLADRQLDGGGIPLDVCVRAPHLDNEQHLAEFAARVNQFRPALVVLDPLYLAAGRANLRDLYEMGLLLGAAQRICQPVDASLWVVTHFNRQQGSGAARITGAGPAEWGRVLITATVKARHVDPHTRATDVITELDVVGGEIPDRTIRVRRHIVADDPDNLDAPLHVTVTATENVDSRPGEGDVGADLPPAAQKLLEALTAVGDTPTASGELVDWIADRHGHGLRRETVSRTLNDLEGRGLVESVEQGAFKAKLWKLRHTEPPCDPCDVTRDGHTDASRVTSVTTPIGGHTSHVTRSHDRSHDPLGHTGPPPRVPPRGTGPTCATCGTVHADLDPSGHCPTCTAYRRREGVA